MIKPIYGVMAEFDNPTALVNAARAAREKGYRKLDAYSPFPIEELTDALDLHQQQAAADRAVRRHSGRADRLPAAILRHGVGFPHQRRRPAALHSWPAYIIITFELTILFAAISAVLGLLALCGLPMPYHPTFNVPRFALASRNRFFLCIEAADPLFDHDRTIEFLETLEPREVSEVAH